MLERERETETFALMDFFHLFLKRERERRGEGIEDKITTETNFFF